MRKVKLLFTVLALAISASVFAQDIEVKGVVSDGSTGEGIPFASLQIKGTMAGVNADADGNYSIQVPANGVLVFSSVGYANQEVEVAGRANINVALATDNYLDDVIVVAYGTTTKGSFTGSASVVKSENLEKRQVSNISNALSGAVSGVQITSSNGQPGSSATVRIRGIGSLYASNNPLYVVDGLPFEGDISTLATQDIESMTVLKDAAASALYGARAANGVILVTTKKGKQGEAVITAEARVGVNQRLIKNYNVLTDPAEYTELVYTALYNGYNLNAGYDSIASHALANQNLEDKIGYRIYSYPADQYLIGSNGKINPNATLGYSDGVNYFTPDNWADEMFSDKIRQEYSFSARGGNDKLSYYLSAGYLDDQGVIEGSSFTRINTRLNVDYQAKKWLKLGVNVTYTNTDSAYPGEQTSTNSSANAFFMANTLAPVYPMFVRALDDKGNPYILKDANTGRNIYDYGDGASTKNTRNYMSISNPASDLLYNNTQYLADVFNAKAYATITFFKGFDFSAKVGAHIDNTRYHDTGNKYYGQSAKYGGTVTQEATRYFQLDQQYLFTYNNTFGKHTVDALAGFESMMYNTEDMYVYGYNMYNDNNWTVSNVIDKINGSGSYGEINRMAVISRFGYNYDKKYYATLSYRSDASSRFAPENRWGHFWSASAAWDIANEDFMGSVSWIDLLKAKASFGQNGNDNLGNAYAYLDQYKVTGADGVFSDGTLSYKGNRDITWEKSNAFNAGVDFGFLRGKISGTIEYYMRQTSDMLYYKPVAASNGYSEFPMNIGSIRNSGVEIELNFTPIETKNLKWNINVNGTTNTNKIIKLHDDLEGEMISGSRIYTEGESMYRLYLVKWAGVNPETGLAEYYALQDKKDDDGKVIKDSEGNAVKEEYKTSNWTAAYNTNRTATTDILPKLYGGIGTDLTFYGFDFSIQCAYQLGGRIIDSGYQTLMHSGATSDIGENWHTDIRNAWKKPGDITDVPRLDNVDSYANSTSDRFLISSNYFSINNITFGYTIPQNLTQKAKIQSIRIYFSGDNLAVFSARKGLDPRQSFTSSTTSLYTALRTMSGGIKFTF